MSFQPVVPLTGYVGWKFLERTVDTQKEAHNESTIVKRATNYFRENISKIETAEDLVNDRQLLEVALGAFGLSDDINNKYFIQKVLEDGTLDDDALSNRLSDSRYKELSKAFGFGDFSVPNTVLSTFGDSIVERYQTKSFEVSVGEVNQNMRLAMNVQSSLSEVVKGASGNDARWFSVMGNPPLRQVFETALGLPSSIGAIDLDQQLTSFKDAAKSTFGTDQISQFTDDASQEKLIRMFLLRSELNSTTMLSSGSIAITLLSQIA